MDLSKKIRHIPDFPKKGILFRDITTLLQDPKALREMTKQIKKHLAEIEVDLIVGIESRGFILGAILAHELGVGFIPIRKKGKLPAEKIEKEYELEYGTEVVEIHADAIAPGQKIIIIDDLLATGGTAQAAVELIKELKGEIQSLIFLIELIELKGRDKIKGHKIISLIQY